MSSQKKLKSYSKLSFIGVMIKPVYAKLINDAMFEMTQIEGAYVYDTTGVFSKFTVYPKSMTFGDDPDEFDTYLQTYKEIYEHVIQLYPESLA